MPQENCAVILAAGEGKRMKRDYPKALAPVLFKPMLEWVLDSVKAAGIGRLCVVTGHLHEQVERFAAAYDRSIQIAYQPQRRGTGHAVMMAADFLRSNAGSDVLILNGDSPLISSKDIQKAQGAHREKSDAVTVISAEVPDPAGYGRIVRDPQTGSLAAIVEQRDASPEVRRIREINSGAYWFRAEDLLGILSDIRDDNTQGEYYLTDAVRLLIERGKKAGACKAGSADAVLGANDCLQLSELNRIAREKILTALLLQGVDIPCRDGVVIGPDVAVGRGVSILPGTILRGRTSVGPRCVIGPNTVVTDCAVGEGAVLNSVQCSGCTIKPGQTVAPYTTMTEKAKTDKK
ncbi:bifunctional N-acetylglucosamine-1-phosphate uridyltransferase/glucosamine-1-phosphate acetyltransferase [Caproiciproducens sp. NJN-50]|uniref:sugar phosphate nucleotidyltransferase n=1 Tax=Acutalibacteraceae TaxID=3082771 RepID=UPI000FFE3373|nr:MULTISPECIES: sugar phosphate nucleotidyltransferase [Acutalibacteraceae]QAT50998.1 bifunctional N-acetylglucosamine-1-phosphate uridyltransferase/glucosamine-1-phosphate acetyltransferase [Caproiciproducens sp. NJN-50]